jgi:hypothetical protein
MKLGLVVVLSIVHVMSGCHAWSLNQRSALTLSVHRGARVQIRISCPMDFDVSDGERWMTGTVHTLVFPKRGTYRFTFTNVQTPEERGLETLGTTSTPKLTVVVR